MVRLTEAERKMAVSRGWREGRDGESLFNACRVPVSQDGNHSGAG